MFAVSFDGAKVCRTCRSTKLWFVFVSMIAIVFINSQKFLLSYFAIANILIKTIAAIEKCEMGQIYTKNPAEMLSKGF